MIIQTHVNDSLVPYQGPVIIRPKKGSGNKTFTRRERRQYGQTPVRNSIRGGVAM